MTPGLRPGFDGGVRGAREGSLPKGIGDTVAISEFNIRTSWAREGSLPKGIGDRSFRARSGINGDWAREGSLPKGIGDHSLPKSCSGS